MTEQPLPLSLEDQELLQRLLARNKGDQFRLVVVDGQSLSARMEVLRWLEVTAAERGLPCQTIDARTLPGVNLLHELRALRQERQGGLLFFIGLEGLTGSDAFAEKPDLVRQMNVQRDLLVRDVPAIWVLLVHPHLARQMRHDAPDFADYAILWLSLVETDEAGQTGSIAELRPIERGTAPDDTAGPERLQAAWDAFARGEWDQALDLAAVAALEAPLTRTEEVSRSRLRARVFSHRGEVDQALALLESVLRALPAEAERERASTLGDIARIRLDKGEVDQALALHQERLSVFDRLGDTRSRAVTLGDIARIRLSKGEVDEALVLHYEELAIFDKLGDTRDRAITLGDIARIRFSKGELDEGLSLLQEKLAVVSRLGDARSRAIALGDMARIHITKGDMEQGLSLLQEKLAVVSKLGDARSRAITFGDIARILSFRGDNPGARRLQEERLSVNRRLGDLDGICFASWDLAQLDLAAQDYPSAVSRLQEAFAIASRIGRVDAIAGIGTELGQLVQMRGALNDARQLFGLARQAAARLGDSRRIAFLDYLLQQLPEAGATVQGREDVK